MCKVEKLFERYDPAVSEEELISDWKDGKGFRQVADELNIAVTRVAIKNARAELPLSGEPEYFYEGLTSEGPATEQADFRDRLTEYGVDVESLTESFVSYQTVRRHFYDCLGIEPEEKQSGIDPTEEEQRLTSLVEHTETVTTDVITRLIRADQLDIGEPEVTASIDIRCVRCGQSVPVTDLSTQAACKCSTTNE